MIIYMNNMKPISGFNGYLISKNGEIYSFRSRRYLKAHIVSGYYQISLRLKEYRAVQRKIHRLVALTYLTNEKGHPVVNHKDGNKLNNHVSNLEWCTRKHNSQHAHRTGLTKPYTRPVCQLDLSGNIIAEHESIIKASKKTGAYPSNISQVCLGRLIKAGGYGWRFKGEEHKGVRKSKNCKPVLQLDFKSGEVIRRFDSAKEAAQEMGVAPTSLARACTGYYKKSAGFSWKYDLCKEVIPDKLFTETRAWKKVVGFPSYRISEDGRIFGEKLKKLRRLSLQDSGYLRLGLARDKQRTSLYVHKLVAQAYISNPRGYPIVNHKDGNKQNNNISNLEWCTKKMNAQHAHDTGLTKSSKKVVQYDLDYNFIKVHKSMIKAADELGTVSYYAISNACRGKSRTSGGFIWEYYKE